MFDSKVNDILKTTQNKLKVICQCAHCGERYGGNVSGGCAMYCGTCKTKPQRDAIDKANKQV